MSRYDKMFNEASGIQAFLEDPENYILDPRLNEKYQKVKFIENLRNNGWPWPKIKTEFIEEYSSEGSALAQSTAQYYINLYIEIKEKDIFISPLVMVHEVINRCDEIAHTSTDPDIILKAQKLKLQASSLAWDKIKAKNDSEVNDQPMYLLIQNTHGKPTQIDAEQTATLELVDRNGILEKAQLSLLPTNMPGANESKEDASAE